MHSSGGACRPEPEQEGAKGQGCLQVKGFRLQPVAWSCMDGWAAVELPLQQIAACDAAACALAST